MEWQLNEERKGQYDQMLKGAQDLEMTIGSNYYRISKLVKMREDLDKSIKEWWDKVIEEMKLEKNTDYMITKDGTIKDVPRKTPQPEVAPSAQPLGGEDVKPIVDTPDVAPAAPVDTVGTNAAELT